jgi:hypothetical protein
MKLIYVPHLPCLKIDCVAAVVVNSERGSKFKIWLNMLQYLLAVEPPLGLSFLCQNLYTKHWLNYSISNLN